MHAIGSPFVARPGVVPVALRLFVPWIVGAGIVICYALLCSGVVAVYRLVHNTDAPSARARDATVAAAPAVPQGTAPSGATQRAPTYGPSHYRVIAASTSSAHTIVIDVPLAPPPAAAPTSRLPPRVDEAADVKRTTAPIRREVDSDGSVLYTNDQ